MTDAGLAHLQGLRDLEILDLQNTGITNVGVAQLESIRAAAHIGPSKYAHHRWRARASERFEKTPKLGFGNHADYR